MTVNLEAARTIVARGFARAEEMGLLVSIAVVDAGGHVIALQRMDGAGFLSPEIALGKAFSAAAFRRSTAQVQGVAADKPAFFAGISALTGGRFLAGMGGLPIGEGIQCLGGVGVSGARADQDQEIAEAGIAALPAG